MIPEINKDKSLPEIIKHSLDWQDNTESFHLINSIGTVFWKKKKNSKKVAMDMILWAHWTRRPVYTEI